VFGATPLAIVGGAMANIWDPIDRGVAVSRFLILYAAMKKDLTIKDLCIRRINVHWACRWPDTGRIYHREPPWIEMDRLDHSD
jgi:hypothetical protein